MAVTLKQTEAVPAAYPATPGGLSTDAAALDPDVIWARIEAYVVHRWTTRAVVWTVEGPGDWGAPLTPATITGAEVWDGAAWVAVFPEASPYGGYALACEGPYRVTATVGGGTVPAAVDEAFRRLAEYLAGARGSTDEPGATTSKMKIGDAIDFEVTRNPAWMARAMQYSGAGDLLRPYREAV